MEKLTKFIKPLVYTGLIGFGVGQIVQDQILLRQPSEIHELQKIDLKETNSILAKNNFNKTGFPVGVEKRLAREITSMRHDSFDQHISKRKRWAIELKSKDFEFEIRDAKLYTRFKNQIQNEERKEIDLFGICYAAKFDNDKLKELRSQYKDLVVKPFLNQNTQQIECNTVTNYEQRYDVVHNIKLLQLLGLIEVVGMSELIIYIKKQMDLSKKMKEKLIKPPPTEVGGFKQHKVAGCPLKVGLV